MQRQRQSGGVTPENNLVKHHTDISEVEGTSAASEKYICMAKSVIVVLAKYKTQELVNQMQGYLDKAAVIKKNIIKPNDAIVQ